MTCGCVPLAEVADVFNGKTPAKTEHRASGHPVLKIRDVDDNGNFCGRFTSFVDPEFARGYERQLVRAGDTLILNAAHNADYVGSKDYRVGASTAGSLATGEWLIVRAKSEKAAPAYLNHWLRSARTRQIIRGMVKGIHLYPKDVARLEIPVSPLPEQQRIAAILDKADAIRHKRQETIALTEELLRSTFLDMFGEPVTNPKGWPTRTVREVAPEPGQIVDGPFGSSLKPECYVNEGVRVIRNFNINDGWFDDSDFRYVTREKFAEIRRSEVQIGDLLISTKGTVGDVCCMPGLPGQSVLSATGTVRVRITSPEWDPDFLVHQMIAPSYKAYMQRRQAGSIQKYLNLSGIREFRLIKPPIELQQRFAEFTRRNWQLSERQEKHQKESTELFNSLAQRAFRGEL